LGFVGKNRVPRCGTLKLDGDLLARFRVLSKVDIACNSSSSFSFWVSKSCSSQQNSIQKSR
jgi:hypothetical protein